jgi:capsular polysaccharide biosynthesis protein
MNKEVSATQDQNTAAKGESSHFLTNLLWAFGVGMMMSIASPLAGVLIGIGLFMALQELDKHQQKKVASKPTDATI